MISERLTKQEKARWFERGMKFAYEGKFILEMVSFKNNAPNWAIYEWNSYTHDPKKVLNSEYEWEEEVEPQKRDKNYYIRTRFSFDTALDMIEMFKTLF